MCLNRKLCLKLKLKMFNVSVACHTSPSNSMRLTVLGPGSSFSYTSSQMFAAAKLPPQPPTPAAVRSNKGVRCLWEKKEHTKTRKTGVSTKQMLADIQISIYLV